MLPSYHPIQARETIEKLVYEYVGRAARLVIKEQEEEEKKLRL